MIFLYPKVLYLLLLIPLFIFYHFFRYGKENATIKMVDISIFKEIGKGWRTYLISIPFILRLVALALIIIALARPQSTISFGEEEVEGIDIMMTIDVSSSMKAMDLKPNRIVAAKSVAENFIGARKNDNIGIVQFSGEAYTISPLTTDHMSLLMKLGEINTGQLEDGTAIGDALATAIARLKDSKAKSKIVILLTDGSNNSGKISPIDAAKLAIPFGIRVYTIGVGTDAGITQIPYDDGFISQIINVEVDVDEPTLKKIAETTSGKFFRATDNESLAKIYDEIDKLEKTKMDVRKYSVKNENYQIFVLLALILLVLEFILRNTLLRKNP